MGSPSITVSETCNVATFKFKKALVIFWYVTVKLIYIRYLTKTNCNRNVQPSYKVYYLSERALTSESLESTRSDFVVDREKVTLDKK